MKALILASGMGKRLLPLTNYEPKSLIKIGDKSILEYQIDNLLSCDIKDIIITTGHYEDKIKSHMKLKYPNLNISYVNNPKYSSTNYIYSIWLTKHLIDDDIILIHGDLFFEKTILHNLLKESCNNCVIVNKTIKPPEKDFKAVIENNRVIKIGTKFTGENTFFLAPLYKMSKYSFLLWLDEIEIYIKKGIIQSYAEDAFNDISDKIFLQPLYNYDELCMEIDTNDDLKLANILVEAKIKG